MLLHCNSKKCNTTREHKLVKESNQAICTQCGELNPSVNDFMKQAMKNANDYYKTTSLASADVETPSGAKQEVSKGVVKRRKNPTPENA